MICSALMIGGSALLLAGCRTAPLISSVAGEARKPLEVRALIPIAGPAWSASRRLHRAATPAMGRGRDAQALMGWSAGYAPPPPPPPPPPPGEPAWTPPLAAPAAGFAGAQGGARTESGGSTPLPGGLVVPGNQMRGIGGSRLRGSIAVRAPDIIDVGLFYSINPRLTVGLIGQALRQDRTTELEGQLVDPGDLASFIPGFSIREETTSLTFGPFIQYQFLFETRGRPALSVGAYALEWGEVVSASTTYSNPSLIVRKDEDAVQTGDSADKFRSVYVAGSKYLNVFRGGGIFRTLRAYGGAGYGMRSGKRYSVAQTGQGDPRIRVVRETLTRHSFVGWAGAEIGLPRRFALFGEAFTGDECEAGYGFGLRWMSPFGVSFAFGYNDCVRAVPQRALDLVYLPGGVGGQPSVVSGGSGVGGGGLGFGNPFGDDGRGGRGRGRASSR